jgi:pimeloyl-ACP methyl ester carboxylesterase
MSGVFEKRKEQIGAAVLHYEVGGEGRPLILLHGLSGSPRWWRYNSALLARHFQVYMVDLFGFGLGRGQKFSLTEAGILLRKWMDMTGIRSANLVGHSMGGYITIDLAANFPQMVHRIVLVDVLVYPVGRAYLRNIWRLLLAVRYAAVNFLPVLFLDFLRAGPVTMFSAMQEVLDADISSSLNRIQAKTLIVWGEKDMVLPVDIGKKLHKLMPGSELVIVEGAGHNPMWDKPQQFNRAVLEFLTNGEQRL